MERIITRFSVAPFTGAWIETYDLSSYERTVNVAPFTGAWIETLEPGRAGDCDEVAPFTGAWIETERRRDRDLRNVRRALHGRVD